MLTDGYKQNFNTLIRAVKENNICIMECKRKRDGEIVALVCAVQHEDNGEVTMIPFAEMMTGDPFEDYYPPNPDGGFFEE